MRSVFVRPSPGVAVWHPCGRALDPAGEQVPWSSYWVRRARDGSIQCGTVPEPAPTVESKPATKTKTKSSEEPEAAT